MATLLSHVKAGNTVRLYTYQNFDESVPIPPEISVEDEHQYFPAEDFSASKEDIVLLIYQMWYV